MAFGFVLIDLVYFALLLALSLVASTTGVAVFRGLSSAPLPLAIVAALASAALAWFGSVLALALLLPRPRPGRYRAMQHPVFFIWVAHFVLRRCLDLPPLSLLVAQSNVLRFLMLRAFGGKVAFSASMSSDAVVLDPALLEVGPGSVLGSQAMVAGHFLVDGVLRLESVRLGANVEIAARAVVAPGAVLGDGTNVGFGANVGPGVNVGKDARIGAMANLQMGCRVGDRARVPIGAMLPVRAVVADDETWKPAPDQAA